MSGIGPGPRDTGKSDNVWDVCWLDAKDKDAAGAQGRTDAKGREGPQGGMLGMWFSCFPIKSNNNERYWESHLHW